MRSLALHWQDWTTRGGGGRACLASLACLAATAGGSVGHLPLQGSDTRGRFGSRQQEEKEPIALESNNGRCDAQWTLVEWAWPASLPWCGHWAMQVLWRVEEIVGP